MKSEINPLKLTKLSLNNNNPNKLYNKEIILPKNLKAQIILTNVNNMNNNKINQNNNIFLINSQRVSNNFNIFNDSTNNNKFKSNSISVNSYKAPEEIKGILIKNLKHKKINYFMRPKINDESYNPYIIYCEKDSLKMKIEIINSINNNKFNEIKILKLDGEYPNFKNITQSILSNII